MSTVLEHMGKSQRNACASVLPFFRECEWRGTGRCAAPQICSEPASLRSSPPPSLSAQRPVWLDVLTECLRITSQGAELSQRWTGRCHISLSSQVRREGAGSIDFGGTSCTSWSLSLLGSVIHPEFLLTRERNPKGRSF